MGNFSVKLILEKNNGESEILEYGDKQIDDLVTNTFVFRDVTRPIFDCYPNEGTLIIKDINLDLYNRALNGDFDNKYRFKVEFYKGNQIIAKHIVNQRPQYNFANKTLILQLGNEIDEFQNISTNGFQYDFDPKRFSAFLTEYLTNNSNIKGYNGDGAKHLKNYFLVYPYLPQTTLKDGLRQILECIGCSLYKKPTDNDFVTIERLLADDYSSKSIYKILPRHISSPFLPTIILDNKFTNIKLNAKNVKEEISTKQFRQDIFDTSYFEDNDDEYVTGTQEKELSSMFDYNDVFCSIRHLSQTYVQVSGYISKYFNNNLSKVLSFKLGTFNSDGVYDNISPSFSVVCKKVTHKYIPSGTIKEISDFDTKNTALWEEESEEFVEVQDLYKTSVSYTEEGKNYRAGLDYNLPQFKQTRYANINDNFEFEEYGTEYYFKADVLCGKKYLQQIKTTEGTYPLFNTEIKLINFIPISISVSYSGLVKEIVFENETVASTENNLNVYENTNENYCLQKGLDYSPLGEISYKALKDIQEYYQNGVKTGTISTTFANYVPVYSPSNEQKTKDQPFEIGDLVIPCKDNFGNPIISKPYNYKKTVVIEEKISGTTGDKGYAILGETVYTYSETKTYSLPIKNIIISNVSSNATASYNISNNGKTLKITLSALLGKARVSCDVSVYLEDNETYNIPVVYKVVGNRIEKNGGAGNQNLTLMEVPLNYTYDIPNLVENDNIETISNDILYDDNGETKEDLSNQNENLNTDLEGL